MRKNTPDSASLSLFDGKRCSMCEQWKPLAEYHKNNNSLDKKLARCKECACRVARQYYLDNPEKRRVAFQEWAASNKDYRREYWRKYSQDNYERLKQCWTDRNARLYADPTIREKLKDRARTYNRNMPDEVRARKNERARERTTRTPGYWRKARHARLARERGADGSHTVGEWNDLCARYGNKCLCCGGIGPLTADHILPLSKGGGSSIDNIQPLCERCNKRKATKHIDYRPKPECQTDFSSNSTVTLTSRD